MLGIGQTIYKNGYKNKIVVVLVTYIDIRMCSNIGTNTRHMYYFLLLIVRCIYCAGFVLRISRLEMANLV